MGCLSMTCRGTGGGLSMTCQAATPGLSMACVATAGVLRLACSLVCSVETGGRVAVRPTKIWLLEDNGFTADVDVESNREWSVS